MYYAVKQKGEVGDELILIRQERFRKHFEAGKEHPHDIMMYGRSVEDAKRMAERYLRFPVDWSRVEEDSDDVVA